MTLDKAKVENGVLIAKRWILSVLRHRKFYALADLNVAIAKLLERLNNRALRKIKQSRHELFVLFDQPKKGKKGKGSKGKGVRSSIASLSHLL